MPFRWFFLSCVIAFVSGETEILVSEPPSEGLWYWNIRTDTQGAGWIHPSTVKKRYKVCDIGDGITREPNNWLQTDFIDVRNATRLDIEVTYNLLNCPKDTSKYCKTYLTLYSYHTDTKDPVPDPTQGVFQKEMIITPKILPPPGSTVLQEVFRGSVFPKANGIYLALLDQGVCVTLTKVVISYKYCPEKVGALVKLPKTVAPANNSDVIEQVGQCTDVNSVSKVKLSGVCQSDGEWNITDDLVCLCKDGYGLFNESLASLECKECPSDGYKNTTGNTNCLQCPLNSASNAERTACTCRNGFYKLSDLTDSDCEALPQAPLKAKTTVVEATHVVLGWQRSPDDNGTLAYAVDCFRCNTHEDKHCNKTCGRQVRFSPRKQNITGVNVTVSGLSSSSFYLFRVYSVNALNQQENDRDNWKFAEVLVETKASPTTVPRTEASSTKKVAAGNAASSTKIVTTGNEVSWTKKASTATAETSPTKTTFTGTEGCKDAMYLKVAFGCIGFLALSAVALACYIIFKRRGRCRSSAKQSDSSIQMY